MTLREQLTTVSAKNISLIIHIRNHIIYFTSEIVCNLLNYKLFKFVASQASAMQEMRDQLSRADERIIELTAKLDATTSRAQVRKLY